MADTQGQVTRAEHMAWCKQRALALVDDGDLPGAMASLRSDFAKHPATDNPAMAMLATTGAFHHTSSASEARRFIEDFA